MHLTVASLVLVGLVAMVEGAVVKRKSDPYYSPISIAGLTVNERGFRTYCYGSNRENTEPAWVCFKYNGGDIRQHMYSPSNLAGFMNNAGNEFVVFKRPATQWKPSQTFRIDEKTVEISSLAAPTNPGCLGWSISEPGKANLGAEFCPGNGPVIL